jgi:hypothetical protein
MCSVPRLAPMHVTLQDVLGTPKMISRNKLPYNRQGKYAVRIMSTV